MFVVRYFRKNFIYVCINAYTAIYMNILYTYSDRQKTEKIHNNANMRNRHTVNGIGGKGRRMGVEPTKNMITQRRQANTSVSLSVCVNMVYIRMFVCVCVFAILP